MKAQTALSIAISLTLLAADAAATRGTRQISGQTGDDATLVAQRRVNRAYRNHRRKAKRKAARRAVRRADRRSWRRYIHFRRGVRLATLPLRHRRIVIGSAVYYYASGVYLVEQDGAYVVVSAPLGARVRVLPYGYRVVFIGPRRFFFVNGAYYSWVASRADFVVVKEPEGAATAQRLGPSDPVIYPNDGQSDEQTDSDQQECHEWALREAGFDPGHDPDQVRATSSRYDRAFETCLTGRGYTVG